MSRSPTPGRRSRHGEQGRDQHRPRPGAVPGRPYNQAIRVGDLVFVAGQLGIVLESGDLAGETVEEQTEEIMRNMSAILEAAAAGSTSS